VFRALYFGRKEDKEDEDKEDNVAGPPRPEEYFTFP